MSPLKCVSQNPMKKEVFHYRNSPPSDQEKNFRLTIYLIHIYLKRNFIVHFGRPYQKIYTQINVYCNDNIQ